MDYVIIGKIVNTHGIKGQLKVLSGTDFPEKRFAVGESVYVLAKGEIIEQLKIQSVKPSKGSYLIKFAGYDSINQVEAFKNSSLAIFKDQLHELDEEEYYYHQIIGLTVKNQDGETIGHIKDIQAYPANDIWIIQRNLAKRKDILIPNVPDFVKEVNLDQQYVVVDLIEGIVPDED